MDSRLFSPEGHILSWVFCPPAWASEEYWVTGFTDSEKGKIFNHLRQCLTCRKSEINATLLWAQLRPRATMMEIIPVNNIAETRGISASVIHDKVLPLVEQLKSVSRELNIVLSNLDIIEKRFSEIREKLRVTNCTIADNIEILIQILSQAKAGIE
jgi:hypothetical protein